MKYYAISDLMGSLEEGCFSKNKHHSVCLFFWKKNGDCSVSDEKLWDFWAACLENGYSLVELDLPSPLPANVFPHKKVEFSAREVAIA